MILRRTGVVLLATSAVLAIACWPVTTRFGVNYQWSSKTIPLYEKAVEFVSRDIQGRRLAREIASGVSQPRDKALRLFAWVGTNVRRTPPGFPVVDDHLWHVAVRGYGAPDQRTEVYALLATYAGVRASSAMLVKTVDGRPHGLMMAVSEFEHRRWLFDVDNQILFHRPDGMLADIGELVADPAIVARAGGALVVDGIRYVDYFEHLSDLAVSFDRIDRQRPLPRLESELRALLHL